LHQPFVTLPIPITLELLEQLVRCLAHPVIHRSARGGVIWQ
jgi:hypothetical protein